MSQNPVRQTTAWVMKQAKTVSIRRDKAEAVAERWARKKVAPPAWQSPFHLTHSNETFLLTYLFLLDSLNFCFWADPKKINSVKWLYSHKGKKYSGYFGLALALKVWFENDSKKANFKYFQEIPWKEFLSIFQGGRNLLFLKKRWEIVRALSGIFVKKYGGDPRRFVSQTRGEFARLVPAITKLPSFNDEAYYKEKKVFLWKRPQILAGDIWGAFHGRGIGKFRDLDYLTAFPDYKLPQILHYWDILRYSPALERAIKRKRLISPGSAAEVEIRAATVQAVEFLREALKERGVFMTAYHIDWILWNESKRIKLPIPHHLTKTIFY